MLDEIKRASLSIRSVTVLGTSSIVIWLLDILVCYAVVCMFELQVPFALVVLAVVIGNLVKAVPLTPGGMGTYEAALAITFGLGGGVSATSAILISVIDHLIKNLVTLAGGIVSIYYFGDWVVPSIKTALNSKLDGGNLLSAEQQAFCVISLACSAHPAPDLDLSLTETDVWQFCVSGRIPGFRPRIYAHLVVLRACAASHPSFPFAIHCPYRISPVPEKLLPCRTEIRMALGGPLPRRVLLHAGHPVCQPDHLLRREVHGPRVPRIGYTEPGRLRSTRGSPGGP